MGFPGDRHMFHEAPAAAISVAHHLLSPRLLSIKLTTECNTSAPPPATLTNKQSVLPIGFPFGANPS